MTSQNSTWGAVVMRRGITWFAKSPQETMHRMTPDWGHTDLPRVVLAAGSLWFPRAGEGTVLWQCQETVDTRRMVTELRDKGWSVSDSGHETGWFTITREGFATVHLGIGALVAQLRFPLIHLRDEAPKIAAALARYHDLTGSAWRGSAGMNGCAQIRETHASKPVGGRPLWRWDDAKAAGAVKCSWELRGSRNNRPLNDTERERRYVHQYDIRAMYLASANLALLGWSAPENRGPQEFDPGRPGYWLVQREQVKAASREVVRPGPGRLVWLTTPVMSYLGERGCSPEVMDSWTSERGGRYTKAWAERLTAALKVTPKSENLDAPSMERALKDTYKRTVGLMAREGGRIFRPDWRDEIVDRARINLIRKCRRVDPVRYNVDAVWIASDEDPVTVGRKLDIPYDASGNEMWQIGKFRHIRSFTPGEYIARYERLGVGV